MPIKTAAEIWRDYVTDGVPASGPQKPVKADIRDWGAAVEGAMQPVARRITTAGSYTVADTDALIIVSLAGAGTVNLALPAVANRSRLMLRVVDFGGSATIVLTPNGTETIMGKTSPDRTWTITPGGGAGLGGKIELVPSTADSGWAVTVG